MFNPVLPNWERDVQLNVDRELDNIRVKPTWVKLGERNPSLAAQRELAEIELRDPALLHQDNSMILLSIGIASWRTLNRINQL